MLACGFCPCVDGTAVVSLFLIKLHSRKQSNVKSNFGNGIQMIPLLAPGTFNFRIAIAVATAFALVLFYSPASAFPRVNEIRPYGENVVAKGYARKYNESSVFYTETYLDDPMSNMIRAVYWDSNHRPISYKQLNFGNNPSVPEFFEVVDYRRKRGYRMTISNGIANVKKIIVDANGAETVTRNNNLRIDSRTVVDAGFQRFVVANWDKLMRGKSMRINFLQIDRARLVPLKIKRRKCDTSNTTCFKISFDNFLLQSLVPSVFMKYETSSKRLLRYTGIGPLTKLNGKSLPIDITYEHLQY